MARLNIEDSIYKDIRFIELIVKMGSVDAALGILVRSWALAQKWYLKGSGNIPIDEWNKQKLNDAILTVGLASIVDEKWVHVAGKEEQFKWLKQCSDAGKRSALSKSTTVVGSLSNLEGSSTSYSSSYSNKELYNTPEAKPKKPRSAKADAWTKLPLLVGLCELVKQHYPRQEGRTAGLNKLVGQINTDADLELITQAIINYSNKQKAMNTEEKFIKHFSSFVTVWKDWVDLSHDKPTMTKVYEQGDIQF